MSSETVHPRRASQALRSTIAIAAGAVAAVLAVRMVNRFARPPIGLGLEQGRLRGCPDSPNCVGSENCDAAHEIGPLAFAGNAEQTMARLKDLLAARSDARLAEENANYLRYEFRSRVCGFVDDVEFRFDATAGVVHVRSASRVGYSDLGVNRRRVEDIRRALAERG